VSDSTATLAGDTVAYPVVTRREASAIVDVLQALASIAERAGERTYQGSPSDAADAARINERAARAREAITSALICAKVYGESERAGSALARWNAR
jgi:hypothetical protein